MVEPTGQAEGGEGRGWTGGLAGGSGPGPGQMGAVKQ